MRIENRALAFATHFFRKRGCTVEDVSHDRGVLGCDLVVTCRGKRSKIEVKGCSREWQIPDLHSTEFDERRRLVADFLCVVYYIGKAPPVLCLIPRRAIKPEHLTKLTRYRIKSGVKKEAVLGRFVQR